ncbi:hypothetical protein CAPTEDRAFT_219561 [Capitella teleta]|uniref:Calcium-activated chloride channel N-terminal domain-containing protein n=1 Tax=Capitella teleta TaxID=283909 RepID=R7UCH3_CAPTE|nr:hypothetical protein CAPTEDRAFT_219561 [Capitella teleta]|eukprot:ELU04080.1 hypothetical protein CAPTEDRAFT_219561 [Capitella teleta]
MAPIWCVCLMLLCSVFISSAEERHRIRHRRATLAERTLENMKMRKETNAEEQQVPFIVNLWPGVGELIRSLPERFKNDALNDDLKFALRQAGSYIRLHKFTDFDRRRFSIQDHMLNKFGKGASRPTSTLHHHFPRQPLKKLDESVLAQCKRSIRKCLNLAKDTYKGSNLWKKNAGAVMKSFLMNQKMRSYGNCDTQYAKPFKTPLRQFQFRTTFSYILCYFTLRRLRHMRFFGKPCKVGEMESDYREMDTVPYGCAMLSFCPDPCFGKVKVDLIDEGLILNLNDAVVNPASACFRQGTGHCSIKEENNRDFIHMVQNRMNYTCDCRDATPVWNPATLQCDRSGSYRDCCSKQINRAYFGEITVLVPETWHSSPIYDAATIETYGTSDFRLEATDETTPFVNNPFTIQFGPCGDPGIWTHLTDGFFLDDTVPLDMGALEKVLVHEWGHLRFGVFDEYPLSPNQNFYVTSAGRVEGCTVSTGSGSIYTSSTGAAGCSETGPLPWISCEFRDDEIQDTGYGSLMYRQFLPQITEFCDDDPNNAKTKHNPDAVTQHNTQCNGRSVWDEGNVGGKNFGEHENAERNKR